MTAAPRGAARRNESADGTRPGDRPDGGPAGLARLVQQPGAEEG